LLDWVFQTLGEFLWQYVTLPLVLFVGAILSFRTGFFQFRRLFFALRETVGKLFIKKERTPGTVTPFQALTTALAGTMGTGSIAGTCQALAVGGAGSIFWMWIASFFGMIIKFFEVSLAIHYRKKNRDGVWVGGPMYYITEGFGKKGKPLAVAFSLFAVLSSLGMGNLAQAGSIMDAVRNMAAAFGEPSWEFSTTGAFFAGLGIALCLALSIFGGYRRIGKVTEVMVPVATLSFIVLCLVVLLSHPESLFPSLLCIARKALSPRAVAGGAAGITLKEALRWGFCRSAFSNEAGLGSAAIAHASADTDHPVRQGFYGMIEVFVDTTLVCTLTAITALVALGEEGISTSLSDGTLLMTNAFASIFGAKAASTMIAFTMIFLAFSTLMGWSLYGCRCMEHLFGKGAAKPYLIFFVVCSFFGALIPMKTVWAISDVFNALMAIPNCIALIFLYPTVLSLLRDFERKLSSEKKKKTI